jgi:hypothetical protein
MLFQNPAIQWRVKLYLVEQAKGGPPKLLLSFFFPLGECPSCGMRKVYNMDKISGAVAVVCS